MLIEVTAEGSTLSVDGTELRVAFGVSMLHSFRCVETLNGILVRPPGFEPGTRGWKPLVITPSLQALGLGGHMSSLNRFGVLNDLKSVCLHGYS